MKILKIILALIMIVSIASCSSDDDNNQLLLTNANLAGVYGIDYLKTVDIETIVFNGIPVTSTTTTEGDTFQIDWTFTENGTFTIEGQYRQVSITVIGNDTTTNTEILLINETGTYVLNANNQTIALAFDSDEDTQVYDIELFNENNLQIRFEESFVEEDFTSEFSIEIGLSR